MFKIKIRSEARPYLKIHKDASINSPVIDHLNPGEEMKADQQPTEDGLTKSRWMHVVADSKHQSGWICEYDRKYRYVDAVVIDAEPVPAPTLMERVDALEAWARSRGYNG